MSSLLDLSAVDLMAAYEAKTLSPSEYFAELLPYVEASEPRLGALYAFDPDRVRLEAEAATERLAKGRPNGPLDGVPVTLKELIATEGLPVPLGTAASPLVPATADAPPAARMREAGAILLAKTTVPDYGMLSSGLSSFHTLARNPWNLACNPGGSSAGAAAAGAAGYGPLHVGTDIGGSVRLPAGWCGLVGFKPSLGRIPIDPYYVGRCAGPMTRTVADAALMMRFLALPDPRDATSLPPEDIAWSSFAGTSVKGLRLGLMRDAGCGMAVEEEVWDAVLAAAHLFAGEGAEIIAVPGVLTRAMLDGLDDFWSVRSWDEISALPGERREKVLPYIRAWAERGSAVDGARAVRGFNQTFAIRQACASLFTELDFLFTPTNPIAAFPADWASPLNDPERPFEHIAFTVPWNMSEQPALSINCGFTKGGMPIGLQIVGRRFADLDVLRLARFYEERRGPITHWPKMA
ncbi:amidase [Azorhizobium oxalatiphilum]|uniref:Amidase n=1 Tax=Azorhizobium oxalatiphilum TaxID=980631 RepID=A0A917BKG2_9HYPH|nr:amidase [Azorhizobium oxalatiphilum]GGF49361.1 amidase [Azorhizobium oxalatiphilum]